MTTWQTVLAILVLLVTPGPTNTLLALGGAERGWRGALRLIPAELAGYLATTLPLALLGARLLMEVPAARLAVTVAAAVWVLWLAVALWRRPARPGTAAVTGRRVFVTTLLNPKALVFGLVLLPGPDAASVAAHFAAFVALIVLVAAGWAALGAAVRGGSPGLPDAWRRATSVWLGALALYLLGRAAGLA